jgi:hypothetical protein
LRKDRRLIFIVSLVLPHQPHNAKRFYATHTEAACPPLDGLAVARGKAFYAVKRAMITVPEAKHIAFAEAIDHSMALNALAPPTALRLLARGDSKR